MINEKSKAKDNHIIIAVYLRYLKHLSNDFAKHKLGVNKIQLLKSLRSIIGKGFGLGYLVQVFNEMISFTMEYTKNVRTK